MIDFIMSFIILFVLFSFFDVMQIFDFHKKWIIQEQIVKTFPSWQGTKKPFNWFVGWMIAKCICDVALTFLFVFTLVDRIGMVVMVFAILNYLVILFFQMIVYVVIERIVIAKQQNKKDNSGKADITIDTTTDDAVDSGSN